MTLAKDRGVNALPGSREGQKPLDARAADALMTALPGGPDGHPGSAVQARKLIEAFRDRVVHRSQIGKRKLDRSATCRDLDDALRRLGDRYRVLVKAGRLVVPGELGLLMEAVTKLEEKLERQEKEISELEGEHPSTT